jgi:hypothetical protein
MNSWFHRVVLSRLWATFLVMGLAFFASGLGTVNLFFLLKANTELLRDYGWQAMMDGGLQQLVELVVTGYASLMFFVIFKVCEDRLSKSIGAKPTSPDPIESRQD